ncbi:MaoC family dehydratase N-terminal domain-containing protein [Acidiferrimicrobium sp. IK]|uniref:MaoC family dehydratase N-terminal domain-containing protein n=1 Tax=Acidiferrimicrobium sp. IK TaxID=2871700 RepID=UPI0021CAE872|nr:MaoC family dehydratase N-terminal domain-containing protein [Acidiferrimicrobium sp. IK]MCU4182980.1 MaoC family dehydratase N-terminal domain-containing protein [Acidiferrimicrobium sp. IK]
MDTSLEGRTAAPFTMVVELGKVREFAAATKSTNPDYAGDPGDHPVSPGTFLMSAAFWQKPENSPFFGVELNWHRILHGEQEFVFHGTPPRAGDVLTGVARIDRVYEKAGKRGGTMTFTESVTEFRNPAGELVAESRGTMIETSQAAS